MIDPKEQNKKREKKEEILFLLCWEGKGGRGGALVSRFDEGSDWFLHKSSCKEKRRTTSDKDNEREGETKKFRH